MNRIPDFTDSERWTIETTLTERFGDGILMELAESEIRLIPSDRELTVCPVAYWEHDDCHFVVMKTGEKNYRCQFFYRLHEQFGTGVQEYDDLAECVVSLLQSQADDGRKRQEGTGN